MGWVHLPGFLLLLGDIKEALPHVTAVAGPIAGKGSAVKGKSLLIVKIVGEGECGHYFLSTLSYRVQVSVAPM